MDIRGKLQLKSAQVATASAGDPRLKFQKRSAEVLDRAYDAVSYTHLRAHET